MPALDIVDRLKLLARGDNLDLADIVCADAVAEIKRLREDHKKINNLIFASGAPLGSEQYFAIRNIAVAKSPQDTRPHHGDTR
jgi:hypothetical protein